MAEGAKDYYNVNYDMSDAINKTDIINAAEGNLGSNYNKILWILDNSYIPTKESSYKTSTEYKSLMQKAGITIENKQWDLSEDDIEGVVGQKIAENIIKARDGKMNITAGGGGVYGKVE